MHIGGIISWGCLAREIENQINFPLDFGFSQQLIFSRKKISSPNVTK
jgi:hypothetical protein